jgi:hypothetical protein
MLPFIISICSEVMVDANDPNNEKIIFFLYLIFKINTFKKELGMAWFVSDFLACFSLGQCLCFPRVHEGV